MADWRTYRWVLPIVGALFAIISIATPAFSGLDLTLEEWDDYDEEWYTYFSGSIPMDMWMIGYWEANIPGGPSMDGWVDDEELTMLTGGTTEIEMGPFLIGFLGLLIGAIAGIGVGILGYRGNFRKEIAALSGILMMGFTLIFIIWVEAEWSPLGGKTVVDDYGDRVTYQLDPGFGIIGPFIGGVLCLAGAFIKPVERAVPSASKQPGVTTQPQAKPTSEARFCTQCGTEVPGDFCPDCGKPFQPLIAQ